MKGNSEAERARGEGSSGKAFESLSEAAIRRQLLLDAAQHPATLLPLAVCVMAGLHLLLIAPVLGGGRVAVVLLGVAGLGAAAGFVWRYVIRYSDEYARRARELLDRLEEERVRIEQEDMGRLREALHLGFSTIGSSEGLNALIDLAGEHDRLQLAFGQRRDEPLSMIAVASLAAETSRQGLSVLSDALGVMQATDTPGRERLEREIDALQMAIEPLRGDEGQAERLRIREETLKSHRERLRMLDELRRRVEKLLYQAGQCEAALHRTRIEMVAIRAGTETSVDSVTEALRRTIRQVKEVQDEMRRLGY